MEYWRLSLIGFDFDRSIFAFILAWCWTVFSYKFNTFNRLWCPHFSGSASSNKTKLKQWSYHFLWARSLFQVHGKVPDFFELLVFFRDLECESHHALQPSTTDFLSLTTLQRKKIGFYGAFLDCLCFISRWMLEYICHPLNSIWNVHNEKVLTLHAIRCSYCSAGTRIKIAKIVTTNL